MKLYKIHRPIHELNGKDVDAVTEFAGSQADVCKSCLNLEELFKVLKSKARSEVTVTEVDVPTDKKGLIDFLNELVGGA